MAPSTKKPFAQSLAPNPQALGSTHARVKPFKNNSIAEAVSTKMVESMFPITFNKEGNTITPPNMLVGEVANKTASNINDSENMMQLLPDLELAKQVLISSILSPNDMMSSELSFNSTADDLGEIKSAMLTVVKDYFVNTYKIEPQLAKMLEEILFRQGSYPLVILPESTIDEAINGANRVSTETLATEYTHGKWRHYGVLGNSDAYDDVRAPLTDKISLESARKPIAMHGDYDASVLNGVPRLDVHDNLNILKYPYLHEKLRQDRLNDAYSLRDMGLEARRDRVKQGESDASLYQPRSFAYMPILTVKTLADLDKPTVGHPLILTLPAESVIPVHAPSTPSEHVGYFIVVDKHGNPVRASQSQDFFAQLNFSTNSMKDMTSQLLAQTRRASEGRGFQNEFLFDQAVQLYTEVIEADLISRLRNGVEGENVKISKPTEIFRVMFARACARMQTQLIYVPNTLMTYMAFDYNDFGVGKSLLEATKILGSIRAMMLFANTMASIKNSVSHVTVGIELDPADPDPDRTVEFMSHEYAKTRQAAYPIGASNPLDIINYLQNAGVQIETSGHPAYPETKVSIEDKNTNHVKVDSELNDDLRKRHLMAIGVSPESVDLSLNVEFATSVISSNLLLAKRAMLYQGLFTTFLGDFIGKYSVNSQIIMDKLRRIVEDNRQQLPIARDTNIGTDRIVMYFIASIEVSLPKPDLAQLETQQIAFENYTKALDMVLPAFVSAEIFESSTMGELGNSVGLTVAILKAHYQRKWLQDNNVLPELFELVTFSEKDGEAFNLLEQHEAYLEGLSKSLMDFMKNSIQSSAKLDEALNKVKEAVGGSTDDGGGGEEAPAEGGEEEPPTDEEGGEEPPTDEEEPPTDEEEEAPPEEEPEEEEPKEEEPPKEEDKKEEPPEEK